MSLVVLFLGVLIAYGCLTYFVIFMDRFPRVTAALLLLTLPFLGAFAFLIAAFVLDFALWGFDLDGRAPPWSKFLVPTMTAAGGLLGLSMAMVVIGKWRRDRRGDASALEADFADMTPDPER